MTLHNLMRTARRLLAGGFVLLAAQFAFALAPAASRADACTAPTNPVACENSKPGADPLDWEVDNNGDSAIQGYATSMSVNVGDTINFKIKSSTAAYHLDIYRLGYYQGLGARLMASNVAPANTAAQPACQTFADTGLVDCGNWSVSAAWTVPSTAVSGVYVANLVFNNHVRGSDVGISQVVFVVRNDASHSDVLYQTSDETWEAYNQYPSTIGNSLYTCTLCPPGNPLAYQGAFKVSYNRPFTTEVDSPGSSLFNGAEYPMIRFLEQNGYDVSYFSGVDTNNATRGALIKNHKLFISNGHDEYWSQGARDNVTAARAAGVNLAFFSGNEMFWRTRFEPSQAGPATADRTLVAYKDTHFNAATDPVSWTGTWRDRRFSSINIPENELTGTSFVVNAGTSRITVPYAYHALRLWRNTAVAGLAPGASVSLAPNTLGYEWDVDADNGFRPAGLFDVSSTTVTGNDAFVDYGTTLQHNSTVTHNMTEYRAPSGALVFGAGTVQWAWGLSDWKGRTPDKNMQQATVNLFADQGAQPATLISGLVPASGSTDTTAPTSTFTSPPTSLADGTKVTLSGTATDAGGQVAGVEVSTDGGQTWHPATGTTSWTYSWTAHGTPTATIETRAVDDSGNLETPSDAASVAIACPCSLFSGMTPAAANVDSGDNTPAELGLKFQSDSYGEITGIRFYKAATNTGTHTGSLWSASGQRLAQVTFSGESASGWQTASFSAPVAVLPNTTYIVSYYAPNGHYSANADYFWRKPAPGPNGGSVADSPPLHALRADSAADSNGVYAYSGTSTFPTSMGAAGNYWVDPVFRSVPAPGAVSNVAASAGGLTSANVSWSAPTTGGAPTQYKVTPYIGTAAQTPTLVNGTPPVTSAHVTGLTNGTTYTFTVQAVNPNGPGPESAHSLAVTPQTAVPPSQPGNAAAQPASKSARVTWTAAQSDGDSAITGYRITPYIGTNPQTPVQVGASATSATVTGLSNGTSYTFAVAAVNGVGAGPSGTTAAVLPQATIFDFSAPATADSGDTDAVELGVKFTADSNGLVTGVRFYKASTNVGPHVGSLWTTTGTRLAQATFTNETDSGWQSVTFASPVAVTAGTTYIASYYTPSGHYSATSGGLSTAVDNPPLHAVSDNTSSNGVYVYGSSSQFPTQTYHAANYWVDAMYALPQPGQVTGVSATAGRGSAALSWTAPTGGGPVQHYVITSYVGSTAKATTTVAGSATSATVDSLTVGTTYTFTVQAANDNGSGPASAQSNAVTPVAPVAPAAPTNVHATPGTKSALVSWTDSADDSGSAISGHTVTPYIGTVAQTPVQAGASASSATVSGLTNGADYTFKVTTTNGMGTSPASAASSPTTPDPTIFDFAAPANVDSGDTSPVELGVKFKADVDGSVTGIRFYKAAANTGTHLGSLWTTGGVRLAQATFTNESADGWQYVTFATPVNITAGTTYVASYFAPNGHYSHTSGALASGADNGVLHAIADSSSSNGVYAYGSVSDFPTNSFNAANYGVDVLFSPQTVPGAVSGVTATAGPRSAVVSWNAPSSGAAPTSYTITPYIGSTAQTSTKITGSPPATSTTVSGLTAGTSYTFTVTAGNGGGPGSESAHSNAVTPTAAALPGAPTALAVQPATSSVRVSWTPPAESGSPITGYTITPYAGSTAQTPVQAGASAAAATVTGLTNGTAYTFTVKATNGNGTGPESTPSASVIPRATLFDFAAPATVDGGDSSAIVLGVKFKSDVDGFVTGIRFYKAAANTGTHVASLYDTDAHLLGQATFAGESASGWQSVTFANPVPVTAGVTYVASYHAPNGHYSVTGAAFASSPFDNPPLHALSDLTSANGVYSYSSTPVYPSSNFNATNYWVDVMFAAGS